VCVCVCVCVCDVRILVVGAIGGDADGHTSAARMCVIPMHRVRRCDGVLCVSHRCDHAWRRRSARSECAHVLLVHACVTRTAQTDDAPARAHVSCVCEASIRRRIDRHHRQITLQQHRAGARAAGIALHQRTIQGSAIFDTGARARVCVCMYHVSNVSQEWLSGAEFTVGLIGQVRSVCEWCRGGEVRASCLVHVFVCVPVLLCVSACDSSSAHRRSAQTRRPTAAVRGARCLSFRCVRDARTSTALGSSRNRNAVGRLFQTAAFAAENTRLRVQVGSGESVRYCVLCVGVCVCVCVRHETTHGVCLCLCRYWHMLSYNVPEMNEQLTRMVENSKRLATRLVSIWCD
jgi:hypothetical protein